MLHPVSINITLHNDLGIETVDEKATDFYNCFDIKFENHENAPIKNVRIPSHLGNSRHRLFNKMVKSFFLS